MFDFKNKKVFFSGYGEKIEKDELLKYLYQNEALIVESFEEADMIIQGYKTPVYLEDKFYLLSREGIEIVSIETLEKYFSQTIDIDSVLLAIKISKDKTRVINLLKNRYFSDEVFLKLLKFYDWAGEGLFDSDENRDVSTSIVQRFSKLKEINHNIQHSPIGVYYTALETVNPKLLEAVYNMPHFSISDKNALQDQPITLKEVVALNPNTPKPVLMQILKDANKNELIFLSKNESIGDFIAKKLYLLNDKQINHNLILSNNLDLDMLNEVFQNSDIKKDILENIKLTDEVFNNFINLELSKEQIVYLSSNKTLNEEQIKKLFTFDIDSANINLLKNNSCPQEFLQSFFDKNDLIYNIAMAHNEKLPDLMFKALYELNDINIDLSLSFNKAVPKEILTKLFEKDIDSINYQLSGNVNTPINILLRLQIDSKYKDNVSNNETYKEFSRNNLGIIREENNKFKRTVYEDFWE